jgi:hypothetical protein
MAFEFSREPSVPDEYYGINQALIEWNNTDGTPDRRTAWPGWKGGRPLYVFNDNKLTPAKFVSSPGYSLHSRVFQVELYSLGMRTVNKGTILRRGIGEGDYGRIEGFDIEDDIFGGFISTTPDSTKRISQDQFFDVLVEKQISTRHHPRDEPERNAEVGLHQLLMAEYNQIIPLESFLADSWMKGKGFDEDDIGEVKEQFERIELPYTTNNLIGLNMGTLKSYARPLPIPPTFYESFGLKGPDDPWLTARPVPPEQDGLGGGSRRSRKSRKSRKSSKRKSRKSTKKSRKLSRKKSKSKSRRRRR